MILGAVVVGAAVTEPLAVTELAELGPGLEGAWRW